MNAAKAARMIGALRFALHELLYVESLHAISDKLIATHSIALANTYHALRDLKLARHYADVAIRQAGAAEGKTYLGHCQDVRGLVARNEEDFEAALSFFSDAINSYRAAGFEEECANTYCNLAQTYYDLRRIGAARRASTAADKIAQRRGLDGIRVPENVIKNKRQCRQVQTRLMPNGEKRYYEVNIYPIWEKDGKISKFIHISKDIT